MITKELFIVPIRIESESNKSEHWSKTALRKKKHKKAIQYTIHQTGVSLPCSVTLTRIAPRSLDEEDNLPAALKCAKDAVADILVPNLAPGRADGDKRISWHFKQEKGEKREYALKIELESISQGA